MPEVEGADSTWNLPRALEPVDTRDEWNKILDDESQPAAATITVRSVDIDSDSTVIRCFDS